jgi:hypothetical protein
MTRALRQQKRVDYQKVVRKYDRDSFVTSKPLRRVAKLAHGIAGRANAAPSMASWPVAGMHAHVEYFDDIAGDPQWSTLLPDDVQLPFAHLDIACAHKWQGIKQQVAMNGSASVRAHFDTVSAKMRIATSNPAITECVGEAAAAMAMAAMPGWDMIWGAHIHSGTGIDQIWRRSLGGAYREYRIVEAKGPGASLGSGLWVPPGYGQMEFGWVINHLRSMQQNGHAAGVEICNALGLVFQIAHQNYGGAAKSYHGLSPASAHAASGNRLTGVVVTASWQADGRLDAVSNALTIYI